MPVLDARALDDDPEGLAVLAGVLRPDGGLPRLRPPSLLGFDVTAGSTAPVLPVLLAPVVSARDEGTLELALEPAG